MIKKPEELTEEEKKELIEYCKKRTAGWDGCLACFFTENCIFSGVGVGKVIENVDMDYKKTIEEKSPLGLVPSKIWKEQRVMDMKAAIHRYVDAEIDIPYKWFRELRKLRNELKDE